ncbi:adenylate cyclase, class 2 [Desulfonauticus submarinus]|uniref:Adenylate cyclase, class 2 n=1 Tax=Desulfonauticus submarinus TaxID=206665 RepID=A0A1G9ZYZ6_9BACT|nr:class IV adenylate cyclase [Desulfonauticus submarinus]SDN26355.1 adenylate cyclase, class 2 [Desulfonauticus submarinus]
MNVHVEREIKFEVSDFKKYEHILSKKAELIQEWVFEKNIVFDYKDNKLEKKGVLLRLRHDNYSKLTLKLPNTSYIESGIKNKIEYEVNVSNFETMNIILNKVGFNVKLEYHKFRKIFKLNNSLICLDIMPFGFFIEIEGGELYNNAKILGLNQESSLDLTYYEIYNIKLKKNRLLKMVFSEEEKLNIKKLLKGVDFL